MMTAALASSVPFASASLENLVSADRACRSCVEVYEKNGLHVIVTRWAGKMVLKLEKHGPVAEFSTRQGDTLRAVGQIVDLILSQDSITSARRYMKKVCRDTKRAN